MKALLEKLLAELRGVGDELAVLVGLAVIVAGVALISIPAACMTAGIAIALFGVGRIAFQSRGGSQ